jgi:2-methylcitrate dehydratase PrpD
MAVATKTTTSMIADFVMNGAPLSAARDRAAVALCDTVGVILAGAQEPAAHIIRSINGDEDRGQSQVLGTAARLHAADAALANAVAAHALDYDDMCFVSMVHPSCAIVPAVLATGELSSASGKAILDAYVVGFELECRLGSVMNPRHYHERGWHCTSSIGTVGAAAAAARVLGLSSDQAGHALGIAASLACGLKENIGTMTKPLHAGAAARHGVMAAMLAQRGFTASEQAIGGPQGYLAAMDSQGSASDLVDRLADLGDRWEVLDTGITVKLYPSCAATHPPLDVLLALVRRHQIKSLEIDTIDCEVDTMTPRLLIHDRPETGLEAKFSMPFCAAAAVVFGHPTVDTFDKKHIHDSRVQELMPRISMRVNTAFDAAAPLSQARVSIRLLDGRTVSERADGARGYPGRLSDDELTTKFIACAERSLSKANAEAALAATRSIADAQDLRALMRACSTRAD